MLQRLRTGRPPRFSAPRAARATARMQAELDAAERAADRQQPPTDAGITSAARRAVQSVWLRYRDACGRFAAIADLS